MGEESNLKSIYFLNTDFTGVIKETIITAASFQKLEELLQNTSGQVDKIII